MRNQVKTDSDVGQLPNLENQTQFEIYKRSSTKNALSKSRKDANPNEGNEDDIIIANYRSQTKDAKSAVVS